LIALTAWLVRRFGAERLGTGTTRGRQPRLAVIDAASVDGRRRLVLIRRDNVEHLMMIGGPTDVVVEANIVRAAGPAREAQAPRAPAATDTLPRAVPLGEGSMWPLQPEPAPAPAPPPRIEPPALPRAVQRHAPPPPSVTAEEGPEWTSEPEPAPPPLLPPQPAPQRRARVSQDPLAGLADEIARTQQQPQPEPAASAEPRPARRESRIPRAQAAAPPAPPPPPAPAPAPMQAAEPAFNSPADQNLAEMANRLEAALRRPAKADGFAEPPSRAAQNYEAQAGETEDYESPPPSPPQRAPAAEMRPARSEARPARADRTDRMGAPKSSLYDSLEQEMASLLGRPNNKP
jgi:hypothetical protein